MKHSPAYPGLPPLAGIASMEEAMKPGLSVEACVQRLKRYHYAFQRLHRILTARITSEPIYELKCAFSLHAFLCAEHTTALRRRVSEMREPPLGLDQVPDPSLERFFDEILAAPETSALLLAVYEKAFPALRQGFENHRATTNPLADHPSVRICRFALLEIDDMLDFGARSIAALIDAPRRAALSDWLARLDRILAAAGGLDGSAPAIPLQPDSPEAAPPYHYDPTPRRDARFSDPYNMGVNAEVFLYDPAYAAQAKTLMIFYKRLREIDVPEMMASILAQTPDKPWAYYHDMSRQLWDEARHAMMGEAGFAQLGIDWPSLVMINFTWSLALNTQLLPLERHAVLYFIEQGLMPRNGKRFEWEVAQASGNPLAALFQDYDWADEVLHARIGRDWYLKEFKNPQEGVRYGDECWSKVLLKWRAWKDQGLTAHRNWWPDLYAAACKRWGIAPDPFTQNYATTYETVRADLKDLSASA